MQLIEHRYRHNNYRLANIKTTYQCYQCDSHMSINCHSNIKLIIQNKYELLHVYANKLLKIVLLTAIWLIY